jgi:hypothetical protein
LRENNYNTGLGGVLFDAEHYARMGPAVWLYGWLILRQTHQTGAIGWVLGGAPIHYREIEEETGFNRRTLERWMKVLRRQKYIETAVTDSGITVKILKAKKHLPRSPESRGVRKVAGSVREVAGSDPQKCVAVTNEKQSRQRFSGGIGSSSLVRINTREPAANCEAVESAENFTGESAEAPTRSVAAPGNHSKASRREIPKDSWPEQKPNSPGHWPAQRESEKAATQQNFSWDLRERMRWMRAERDEAVRRELSVGSGPEVRHP